MTTGRSSGILNRCSFCDKREGRGTHLLGAEKHVRICSECVTRYHNILEKDQSVPVSRGRRRNLLSPKEISDYLNQYVVGQQRAKKALSVAVYNHYKRIWYGSVQSEIELQKTNILMIGPTGCGKTLLAQTLARILDVPFAICDATSLTESGYVGEDVENILLRLIQSADWDIAKAEHGIIYIDEIDKIARKEGSNPSITRDVSGEGVQQELLKIIEGCAANVPPQGGRKHPYQESIQIKTQNILFICGGVFDGLDTIVARRQGDQESLGFKTASTKNVEEDKPFFRQTTSEDLLKYGFIPELIGRLPVEVALEALDEESLIRVLIEPKNAIIKQYQQLFNIDGLELEFTKDALQCAAEDALKRQTGARGLRTIIEETLLDVMYELPSLRMVTKCIIDGAAIKGQKHPLLLTESGQVIEPPIEWQLSA